ncbi:MAG: hypothetical protein GOP50_12780 [Candidatus Heimdallarchaeota archaeon]|nr:hypothetical protein [Candidatus Heimdallarchaeota archaeon]
MDRKVLRNIFIAIASLIVIALLFEIVAMVYFPGGNHVTGDTEGFDFIYNTLTDLGRDPTPSGKPNLISRPLYRIAIFYMSFFSIVYHSIIWKFFTKNKLTKYLSIAGSFFGIAQAGLYIGVLFVEKHPEHNQLIEAAAGSLILSVLLYTIAFFRNKDFHKINKWTYFSIFCVAIIYAIVILIGFLIVNSGGSNVIFVTSQRIGHTLFSWCLKISFTIQSVAIYYFLKQKEVVAA